MKNFSENKLLSRMFFFDVGEKLSLLFCPLRNMYSKLKGYEQFQYKKYFGRILLCFWSCQMSFAEFIYDENVLLYLQNLTPSVIPSKILSLLLSIPLENTY